MAFAVQVWDEIVSRGRAAAAPIRVDRPLTTVRDLLCCRVQQEVERYNEALPEVFCGLVQPGESEQILNGFRMKHKRPLDWEAQFKRACSSFEQNGFLVLVDGAQVTELDAPLELKPESEVQFVKLVPLVGG